jgi:predicted transcriptional regulator of viral defense system
MKKNISNKSRELLSYFNHGNIKCFGFEEASKALPESSHSALKETLRTMALRGLLMRLKRGLYYIIPYEQDSDSFMPDWHLVSEHLVKNGDHYIGYYSALQVHNLITQPSLKQQIVVSKQVRPSVLEIKGVQFQFVYHNPKHFFGSKKIWIDSYHKVRCSDLEKTLVDCLYKPDYAGGIVEIARALHAARDEINYFKLLEYIEKFKSQAVIKRLGFLIETLERKTEITNILQEKKTPSYILLDTELPRSGKTIDRWSIQLNVDAETIQSAIYT